MTNGQASETYSNQSNIGHFLSEEAALAALVEKLVESLDPFAMWLFGSRARGCHRADSDYNLLVVAKPGQAWADHYEQSYIATAHPYRLKRIRSFITLAGDALKAVSRYRYPASSGGLADIPPEAEFMVRNDEIDRLFSKVIRYLKERTVYVEGEINA